MLSISTKHLNMQHIRCNTSSISQTEKTPRRVHFKAINHFTHTHTHFEPTLSGGSAVLSPVPPLSVERQAALLRAEPP